MTPNASSAHVAHIAVCACVCIHPDALIQSTVRKEFNDCTVITVAHRLDTIIDSDRILVMGRGKVLEFDAPSVLLADPDSHFSRLVDETGPRLAAVLRARVLETPGQMAAALGQPNARREDEEEEGEEEGAAGGRGGAGRSVSFGGTSTLHDGTATVGAGAGAGGEMPGGQ